jgi:pilus assembly protein CpaC
MNRFLALLWVGLWIATAAHPAPQVVAPPTARLSLEIGKGRLIRLDNPAASVFIADPKIADIQVMSPTLVYVTAKSPGATSLFAVDGKDAVLASLDIAVSFDESELSQTLKRLLPGRDISVSSANTALVLSGTVASAADAETARTIAGYYVPDRDHVVNSLKIDEPEQVNLRVRVAEVSRDIIKAFGFNWDSAATPGNFGFGLATGNPIFAAGATGLSQVLKGQNGVDNLFARYAAGNLDLNVLIDALDSEGLIKILAEPNLTAVSGAQASFLAGGEFPIPVPQGLNVVSIDFKKYGVSLAFVATVTSGARISLLVKPEVSQLSNSGAITLNGVTVPALTTRRAETTVDLASGQSFAIAGLMQNTVTQNIQKFPGLGNLSVLGALFRSTRFERNETELVIIVTPYIVRPVGKRLAAPTDGYVAPSDRAMLLKGADYTPTAAVAAPTAAAKESPPR